MHWSDNYYLLYVLAKWKVHAAGLNTANIAAGSYKKPRLNY